MPGDFQDVVDQLQAEAGITTISDADLRALSLSREGVVARDVLLADQNLLRSHGLAPLLDVITGYPQDKSEGPIQTDVYSFHADRAPVEADTYLCTYIGRTSEGLLNETAIRRIDIAPTRAELLQKFGGPDNADFAAYLSEHCFDLHYKQSPGAEPYPFGLGNLWRIAIAYPGSPVPPCIHRAPMTLPGDPARLLLIS